MLRRLVLPIRSNSRQRWRLTWVSLLRSYRAWWTSSPDRLLQPHQKQQQRQQRQQQPHWFWQHLLSDLAVSWLHPHNSRGSRDCVRHLSLTVQSILNWLPMLFPLITPRLPSWFPTCLVEQKLGRQQNGLAIPHSVVPSPISRWLSKGFLIQWQPTEQKRKNWVDWDKAALQFVITPFASAHWRWRAGGTTQPFTMCFWRGWRLLVPLDLPADLDSLIALAIRTDNRIGQLQWQRGRGPAVVEEPSLTHSQIWSASHQSSLEQHRHVSTEGEGELMQQGRARLKQEERLRRQLEGRCFYCSESGHLVIACPAKRSVTMNQATISGVISPKSR